MLVKRTIAATALVLAACGGGPTATPPSPDPPDFQFGCQPSSFAAGAGCATSLCTVQSIRGFAGPVSFSCASLPPGMSCGFGPHPLTVPANGTARTGFTVAADLGVPARVHSFEVVATSGGLRRTSPVTLQTGLAPAPPTSSSRSMMVSGCAGYDQHGLNNVQMFAPAIVGAWTDGSRSFCGQTDSREDGRFNFEISERCFSEGQTVYLTAGGLGTCFSLPFARGGTAHVVLIGSRSCPRP